MKESDLHSLVNRIKASDHGAFEFLFNSYQDAIFHFLLFKTKDPAVAEDLLQEVFFKVWKTRSTLNEQFSIKNYLYTIADNMVLNHFRHAKVVERHQQQSESRLFQSSDNPHFILEEQEWNNRLQKAIESLPDKTRSIFLMSRVEDLTYQEIGDRLGVSVKVVEGNIVKALKLLRETLSLEHKKI